MKKIYLRYQIIFLASILISCPLYNAEAGVSNYSSLCYSNSYLTNVNFIYSIALVDSPIWMLISLQNPYNTDSLSTDTLNIDTTGYFNIKQSYNNYNEMFSVMHPRSPFPYSRDNSRFDPTRINSPAKINKKIKIDSLDDNIIVNESIGNIDVSEPKIYDINDYAQKRKDEIQREVWDSLISRYDLKAALSKGDIANFLGQSTGLSIPIPPNPVLNLFGKPEININVSGEINLRVGWRWDSQNLGTISAYGQTQSTPIFSQDINVNVSASIGDKLKFNTDWNTKRQFEYQNKFKIAYEGYDDDIVRLVEVGNVSLPLQSTLISGGEALFGVRADFQFGPLYLKTLMSQKKGERKMINVQGGVSKQYFQLRAYDYAKNHFFLDSSYKAIYREYFKYSTPVIPISSAETRVKKLEVWESQKSTQEQAVSADVVAFAELPYVRPQDSTLGSKARFYDSTRKWASMKSDSVVRGKFGRLDSSAYKYDPNLGTLTIYNLKTDRNYAVAYRIEGPTSLYIDDRTYGNLTDDGSVAIAKKDTLLLKLIYVSNLQPSYKVLWNRQMRNIYSINATNVSLTDTKIGMWYIRQSNDSSDVLNGATDKIVTIFGVDQVTNGTGQTPGDGQFDMVAPFFDATRGEIQFPSLEPFREGLRTYFAKLGTAQLAEQYIFPDIYDTTYDVARKNTSRDRFIMSGQVSGQSSNKISLGAFNLAPNSVKVSLDGVQLVEYTDYTIDYYNGQLTLLNQRALISNANLKIEYESQDVFTIATKTLMGLRADYQLAKTRYMNTNLGFTFMYYDQAAVIDRVRLGEEPVSNSMLGLDGKMTWDVPWITKALNSLPFYSTKEKSSLQAGGEVALILPTPNKRTSDVVSDNGEPVVYLDDFEGAQLYVPLGLSPSQWQHSSQPEDSTVALTDLERAKFRGRSYWWQYFIPRVPIKEVYPNQETTQGNTNLSPLYINFEPDMRGIYNRNPEFVDSLNPSWSEGNNKEKYQKYNSDNQDRIWGGMMRLLSSYNTNFDNENIEYLEIMMNINAAPTTKMYIDIGQISEDIIPNGKLDTEDGITAAAPIPNGIIDTGEDVGLDSLTDAQEKISTDPYRMYPDPLNREDDPARDDYSFDFSKSDNLRNNGDFVRYNNFEGNATISESGQFPNTEILNSNNGQSLSTANDYFTYEINLNTDPNFNPQIVGSANSWRLYRIPIRKPTSKTGNPLFSNIQYVRVWFKGGWLKLQIADWNLVGSRWQTSNNFQPNVSSLDSTLQASFVNVYDNSGAPEYYTMPPGVQAPKQLNNPDPSQDVHLNEQSLALTVKNLRYGDQRMAVRIFQQSDIFYYKKLKFFIHGDGSMPSAIVTGSTPKAYAYIRFGIDSANYYEYKRPLIKGWQDIEITMSQLTAIKQLRDAADLNNRMEYSVPNDAFAKFAIKGNPTLTKIVFFGFGVENPSENYPSELTTTMWLDELRLISPEASPDWAATGNLSLKLADLGTINANVNRKNPNFHQLEERFGDRNTTSNWSVSMQGNLEKFAPRAFKDMKLPISYSHSEIIEVPKYVANNDINLEDAANAEYNRDIRAGMTTDEAKSLSNSVLVNSQTLRVMDNWGLQGVKFGIPVNFFLINQVVNKITLGYTYSQTYERSPVVSEHFQWQWRLTTQYSNTIPPIFAFKPYKWADSIPVIGIYKDMKFNILPNNITLGMNLMRQRTTEQSRFLDYASPVYREFTAQRNLQASWKLVESGFLNPTIDYTLNITSTLVPFELDENGVQRTGSQIAKEILFNDGKIMNFGKDNIYTQNVVMNFKPRLPFANITKYLEMTGSYSANYNWTNPLQQDTTIADAAKNASVNSTLRFNSTFRLKSLADSWFGMASTDNKQGPGAKPKPADTSAKSVSSNIGQIAKVIFLDFDKVDFSFNQTNSAVNPGEFGGPGFDNLWSRGVTLQESRDMFGPSLAYQLGLVGNPHGGFNMASSSAFPFFRFDSHPGKRPPNAVLQDNYAQKSTLEVRTSRPLWEGATLSLNWKLDISFNRNQTVTTDSNGVPSFSNIVDAHNFTRTFMHLPTIFGWDVFNNEVDHVIALFDKEKTRILAQNIDTVEKNKQLLNALSSSFVNGLETFKLFNSSASKMFPAVNWTIRWQGLEKWIIWKDIVKKVTVEHNYTSIYNETAQSTDAGSSVSSQSVQFGFSPLIGVSFQFDEKKLKGNLTGSLRYNSTSSYQLSSATPSLISANYTKELQLQGSYVLKGFTFPMLGMNVKNDLEFSFLGSYKHNNTASFDVLGLNTNEGQTLSGSSVITIEPRARYSISDRVTASFFIRYEGTHNEGASNSGYHSVQVGFDIRISLMGGK